MASGDMLCDASHQRHLYDHNHALSLLNPADGGIKVNRYESLSTCRDRVLYAVPLVAAGRLDGPGGADHSYAEILAQGRGMSDR
jgi:hypothetical protein